MQSFKCSNCSLLNFVSAAACKRCGLPFDPAAATEMESDSFAPSDSNFQAAEGGSHFWDQPSPPQDLGFRPEAKSSGISPLIKIVVAVAVIAMVSALAVPRLLKSRKADLSNLTWTDYRSPDGRFSVSLPVAPKITPVAIPIPGGSAPGQSLEVDLGSEAACHLMYVDVPTGNRTVSEDAVYDMALKGAQSRQTVLAVGTRRYITQGVYRGMEAELTPTDPNVQMSGGVRIFWVSSRLYVLVAGGPNSPEMKAVQTRFLESFRLLKAR